MFLTLHWASDCPCKGPLVQGEDGAVGESLQTQDVVSLKMSYLSSTNWMLSVQVFLEGACVSGTG